MNKSTRTIITLVFVMAAAMAASAIMMKVTPNDSWLAFAGWGFFFVALQVPVIMGARSPQWSCWAWLARLRNKG